METPFANDRFCLPAKPPAVEIAFSGRILLGLRYIYLRKLSHLTVYRLIQYDSTLMKIQG